MVINAINRLEIEIAWDLGDIQSLPGDGLDWSLTTTKPDRNL